MKHIVLFIGVLTIMGSCKKEDSLEHEIAKIPMEISVERFDILFSEASVTELPQLKKAYPFMFSEKYPDSFWVARKQDTLQVQVFEEVAKAFTDFTAPKQEITSLFQHLKYYFPEFKAPRVITVTNSVDYRYKVIVTDTIVLISLDNYLGSDHKFYQGIPKYIRQDFYPQHMVVDIAAEYAKKYIYQKANTTLLDEMIYFGKQLYFKDLVIPFKTDAERISYTQAQWDWAQANESYIWRFFVERELLFSTDSKLPGRFINPAPFSKFYLEDIDRDSPGRLGRYMGWQIVRAYMEHNNVPLQHMLSMPPEEIFNDSKYKPKK